MAFPVPQETVDKAARSALALIDSGVEIEEAVARATPKRALGGFDSGTAGRIRRIIDAILLERKRSAAVAAVQVKATASKEAAVSSLAVATKARVEAKATFEAVKVKTGEARTGAEAANVEAVQAIEEGRNTLLMVAIVAALAVGVVLVLS